MGQIANQMALELFFKIKERIKEKKKQKQDNKNNGSKKQTTSSLSFIIPWFMELGAQELIQVRSLSI